MTIKSINNKIASYRNIFANTGTKASRLPSSVSGISYNGTVYTSGQTLSFSTAGAVFETTVLGSPTLRVTCVGARGSNRYYEAGFGGSVTGTYTSTPAGTYYFVVGQAGPNSGTTGGYPGGGDSQQNGAPGGGFSGWWRGTNNNPLDAANRSNYLLIGAGGGGRSNDTVTKTSSYNSGGGYPTGSDGERNDTPMVRPTGGTQSAAGTGGLNNVGSAQGAESGSGYTGGRSGTCPDGSGSGGSGGGGYYGGGGGNAHCGQGGSSGGGGSSYYDSARISSFSYTNSTNNANGSVTIEVL
jgi:hypothetical protein